MVLTNPPFGRKSSMLVVNEEGEEEREGLTVERPDFWATTSNKQLNFLQHGRTLLKINGRAAVVVPDNVLFFDKRPGSAAPWTKELWIYDLRTNTHFTLKTRRLERSDLDEFVACFHPANRHERTETWSEANSGGRWQRFAYEELAQRDEASLDVFWLRDESLEDSAGLPEPDVLAAEIVEDLRAALAEFAAIQADLAPR